MSVKGFNVNGVIEKYDYNELDNKPSSGGITAEVKHALLNLLSHVAYADANGQAYYTQLQNALLGDVTLTSISSVFNQGSAIIYDTDSLDTLRQYLVVTATYSDGSTATVTYYTLSGTLTVGTSTITVSYGGKTTTFTVTVTETPAQEELWINTLGGTGNYANYTYAPFVLPNDGYDYNYNKQITAIEFRFSATGTISIGYCNNGHPTGAWSDSDITIVEVLNVSSTGNQRLDLAQPLSIPSGGSLVIGQTTDTARFIYGDALNNGFVYSNHSTNQWVTQSLTLGLNVYRG